MSNTPRGNKFLLEFVDSLSRYVELVFMTSESAICVAGALRYIVVTLHSCPRAFDARELTGEMLIKQAEFYSIN